MVSTKLRLMQRAEILLHLVQHPSATLQDVAATFGVSQPTVTRIANECTVLVGDILVNL